MDTTPKISVIIPSYNHKAFIGHAIQSVLDQDFQDFELLISDDCSSDGSRKIIESFQDPRIHTFFQEKNLGPVYAIQFLNQQTRGEYIALLNSDDYWMPEKLRKQNAFLDAHPEVGACFTQGVLVDENERLLTEMDVPYANIFMQPNRTQGQWLRYFWEYGNALAHMSILVRREIYANELLLNPALRQLPDMDLWSRLLQKYQINILQDSLFSHRRTNNDIQNTSAVTPENSIRAMHEEAWIISNMLATMPDDLFQNGFKDLFAAPHASDPIELRCERFFMMKNYRLQIDMRQYAIAYFIKCSTDSDFVKCMVNKYCYDLNQFFKLNSVAKDAHQSNSQNSIPSEIAHIHFSTICYITKLYIKKKWNKIIKKKCSSELSNIHFSTVCHTVKLYINKKLNKVVNKN